MFFNSMNLDTNMVVAILAQDSSLFRKVWLTQRSSQGTRTCTLFYKLDSSSGSSRCYTTYSSKTIRPCKLLITPLGYMTLCEEGTLVKGDGRDHFREATTNGTDLCTKNVGLRTVRKTHFCGSSKMNMK